MTVLVTGAGGLLGSHVCDVLVDRGVRPRGLLAPGEHLPFEADRVDVVRGDVRHQDVLQRAVRGVDVVFHCAARTGPWGPYDEYHSTNVVALAALVRLACESGVRRIVHVSSITVHGNDVRGSADETAALRGASNPYSRTKVEGEHLLRGMIAEGAPVTIVRPGCIYGPRDAASFGRFATMIREGRMVVLGSGRNDIPLVYVRDVAEGMLAAAESDRALGRAYLLVNDQRVTQQDYFDTIAYGLGVPPPTRHVPYQLARLLGATAELVYHAAGRDVPPPLMRYGVEVMGGENRFRIDRARRELGFSPRVALRDGVERSLEWYRSIHDGLVPAGRS